MTIDRKYKEQLETIDKIINKTPSRTFGKLFSTLAKDLEGFTPTGTTDKQKIASLNRYAARRIKELFQLHDADIKQEMLRAVIKDANRYSKTLSRFLHTKPPKYVDDTLAKWTDQHYTYIRKIFNGSDPISPQLAQHAENMKRFFENVGYDGKVKTLYRGINTSMDSKFMKYRVGDIFSDKAPSSWTSNEGIGHHFSMTGDGMEQVILQIENAKGVGYDMHMLSQFANEDEYLLKDNEMLKVTKVIELDDGTRKIIMEPMYDYSDPMFTRPTFKTMHALKKQVFNEKNIQFSGQSINQMYRSLQRSINRTNRAIVGNLYMEGKSVNDITYALAKTFRLGGKGKAIRSRARAYFNTSISIVREKERDVVEQEYIKFANFFVFDAHMDTRTTAYCRDHNERKYPISKYPTREALAAAGVICPAHFNCRSVIYLSI